MPGAGPVGEHLARLHLTHGSSELLGRVFLVLGTLPGTETQNSHNCGSAGGVCSESQDLEIEGANGNTCSDSVYRKKEN